MYFWTAGESSTGLVRTVNDDAFCIVKDDGNGALLAVVADGLGGHDGSDLASMICCRELALPFFECADCFKSDAGMAEYLVEHVRKANKRIYMRNLGSGARCPMATTMTALAVNRGGAVIAHIGDSRCYGLKAGGGLSKLTTDHHMPADLPCRTDCIPERVLMRSMGIREHVIADMVSIKVGEFDRLLLCTDGLYKELSDDSLAAVLGDADEPYAAVGRMLDGAYAAGARDNVTALAIFIDRTQQEER